MARCKELDGEAHAIDIGAGAGLLSVLAARAGADSVVACDLHEPLATVARRVSLVSAILQLMLLDSTGHPFKRKASEQKCFALLSNCKRVLLGSLDDCALSEFAGGVPSSCLCNRGVTMLC